MQNTKLISLFKTFSPVEFKEFDKFLSSPFHAGDRNLRPFFETLKDFYPDFDDPNLTSEETFRVLYPDEKFDESRIRKLSSFLFKMAEEYLIIVELRGKTIERKFMLLEQFRKRGLDSPYNGLANSLDKDITTEKFEMEFFYVNRLHYSLEVSNYYYAYKNDYAKAFSMAEEHISNAVGMFLFFLFKAYNIETIAKRSFVQAFNPPILSEMKKSFDLEEFMSSEAVQNDEKLNILIPDYHIYKSLFDLNDTKSYQTGKELFLKNIPRYSRNTNLMYFRDFNSINLGRLNAPKDDQTRESTRKEIFEMVKLQLKLDAIVPDHQKFIPNENYRYMLHSALNVSEYDWAEDFIGKYTPMLEPNQRSTMKFFSLALLEFKRKNFEKSLEHLIKVKHDTPFLKFGIRQLNFMLFFELGLYEEARYFLDTTQKYYYNTKELSPSVKARGENFIKYFKLLLRYSDKKDIEQIGMNFNKLQAESAISDKDWLLSKFEGILNPANK